MRQVKVSIIIPVYNKASLVKRCLNSVFAQAGSFDLEVIVVDDGSTDDSVVRIKDYGDTVILIEQPNQGPAAARNNGIKIASGKYLSFLDADDYWYPHFLEETVGFMERHPITVAASVAQIHRIHGIEDVVMPRFLEEIPKPVASPILLEDFYQFWTKHNHVCTGSVLMRTHVVKKTNGQRLELRITEDIEFWAYLATFGPWGFIPKILFVSDDGDLGKAQGWIAKDQKRWNSAPSIEFWSARISQRLPDGHQRSFRKVEGMIARRLSYSMILSNRSKLARRTILKYGSDFPRDLLSLILKMSASLSLLWNPIVFLINYRETYRRL